MRYPAELIQEGETTVAIFRFSDGSECATEAGPGESIEALALEALAGRLKVYLDEGLPPPLPHARAPTRALWVELPGIR